MSYVIKVLSNGNELWTGYPLTNGWFVNDDDTPDVDAIRKFHLSSGVFAGADDVVLIDEHEFRVKMAEELDSVVRRQLEREERLRTSTDPNDFNLNRYQWQWFVSRYGYDVVIDDVLSTVKSAGDQDLYATLKSNLEASNTYRFSSLLAFLTNPTVVQASTTKIKVDEQTLAKQWMTAHKVS